MGFLPSWVNITGWMHHMDADKINWEKARWKLHKNATNYIEQILEAIIHETTAVRPLTSYLKNHLSMISKTCGTLLQKQGQTHKWHSFVEPYAWTYQCWPTSKNLFTVWTRDVIWKTCQEQWMIWTDGKRESRKSVLLSWLDNDENNFCYKPIPNNVEFFIYRKQFWQKNNFAFLKRFLLIHWMTLVDVFPDFWKPCEKSCICITFSLVLLQIFYILLW